jgi:AraC-like DNA-binding protein
MSSPFLATDGVQRLASFLAHCQLVAGRSTVSPGELRAQLDRIAAAIPSTLSHDEDFVVRALFVYTLMKVARSLPGDGALRDDLLLRVAQEASDVANLTTAARMLAETWRAQLAGDRDATSRPPAGAALHIIERRYADPSLRLACVARELNRSSSYVARLLKQSTRAGFRQHLHQARIRAAERLLLETSLSIKEIAVRVGYQRTNQLDIHFRRLRHSSPTRYRAEHREACGSIETVETIDRIDMTVTNETNEGDETIDASSK